jgi:hypothetical protein
MNAKLLNGALLIFWVLLGLAVGLRQYWMPGEVREKFSDETAQLAMLLAALLAVWNAIRILVRWKFGDDARKSSPEVEAYRRRIRAMTGEDPKVTDPQFKFDDDSAGTPPGNGHPA